MGFQPDSAKELSEARVVCWAAMHASIADITLCGRVKTV
jgi:hypothetical protein